jgi:hypothetical protein
MAYKFQLGSATLSGSTTFEEDVTVASLDASNGGITQAGAIAGATTISGSGAITGGSFTTDGAVTGGSLTDGSATLSSGGLTLAGALGGATTISGSGAISGGSVSTDGAVTGGSLTDGTATLSSGGLTLAGALGGATTISGSGAISGGSVSTDGTIAGASIQVGGNSVISNFEGTGLSVSAGTLNVATDVITVTGHGDADTTLAGGFNYSNATLTDNRTRTIPTGSGISEGQIYYVKAGQLNGNTLFVSASGTDVIDQANTQISIESDGGAVNLIYIGNGNFNIF